MNLNRFLKEVHQNAVDHGFWEGERDITESAALIHSEWSEALEEYRADRPMIWYECKEIEHATPKPCDPKDLGDCLNYEVQNTCPHGGKKPEGIAVELLDGCIRILDLFGKYGRTCSSTSTLELINRIRTNNPTLTKDTSLPTLVCALHSLTAKAADRAFALTNKAQALAPLEPAIGLVFFWLSENGVDPEKLMAEKHEFNKSRPYKHGKKC